MPIPGHVFAIYVLNRNTGCKTIIPLMDAATHCCIAEALGHMNTPKWDLDAQLDHWLFQ